MRPVSDTLNFMPRWVLFCGIGFGLFFLCETAFATGQAQSDRAPVSVTIVDETGLIVVDAQVTLTQSDGSIVRMRTDYAGHCSFTLLSFAPYQLRVDKPGFYETHKDQMDPLLGNIKLVLVHEQMIRQEVNVTASASGIDLQQFSNKRTLTTSEIISIPYPTSRDIRNLLPFNPGVLQDESGQVHVAGSDTYETLDLLDGFDIRSPVSGMLAMRVSADAVRTIDTQTTRYPVEYGRSTGGVIAFFPGMGDNKFRLNATNFLPSFHDINGLHFDKFAPRFTFSGPLVRNRAWFFDGVEMEYDNVFIKELPENANTNHLVRGSNLAKFQVNLMPSDVLSGGLLFNNYHSPYDGLSSLNPQQSTTKRNTIAWMPYLRNQYSFASGALLDVGIGGVRFRDGYQPQGNTPFEITPETTKGGYFENLTGRSQRIQTLMALYFPPRYLAGKHELKVGLELNHIGFDQWESRAPINYLREDGTLLRRSVFPQIPPFTRHNVEVGAYTQDRWTFRPGLLVESGIRFDWDEIIRRPLISPRLTLTYAIPGTEPTTKLSAGIGLYYEHTQLEYLERALAGVRYDTYYAPDGATPVSDPLKTSFIANNSSLREMRTINWSIGLERKLPGSIYADVNFLQKRSANGFTYQNLNGATALSGPYLLTNARKDRYHSIEIDARRSFAHGYRLFVSYTHSSARTNTALDYIPTISMLGPQQSGPLAWDVPNRVISWGWLPFLLPKFKKSWDFVYTFEQRSGFPFTAIDANYQVVGRAGAQRFPSYVSFSPGLEWRFHFHGSYFGLRGVMENATDSRNPSVVNNVIDSPAFGTFSEYQGRTFTARIRLINTK